MAGDGSLMTRLEAAEFLGLRPQTLAKWAMDGRNLPVLKLGDGPKARVMYRRSDLERFVEQHLQPATG